MRPRPGRPAGATGPGRPDRGDRTGATGPGRPDRGDRTGATGPGRPDRGDRTGMAGPGPGPGWPGRVASRLRYAGTERGRPGLVGPGPCRRAYSPQRAALTCIVVASR
ncbi:hypothetical protein GCM10010208_69860 [Actinomadura livida]|nr:hypothetical protein GCM10010208_69860 [Actinomadura livida]